MMVSKGAVLITILLTSGVESQFGTAGKGWGLLKDKICEDFNCNNGTCYADSTGSPSCFCPEGCTGEACADDDNSSCEAAGGMCVADDGTCAADNVLDIPCCNGKVCCQENPCDGVTCNSGTCYVDESGSPSCCCPEGCKGDTCAEEDNSSCEAADGMCVTDDGTCATDRVLDIPCCNGKVCCQEHPCDNINCNTGTCYTNETGSTLCVCPEGCIGDDCTANDDGCSAVNGICYSSAGFCTGPGQLLSTPCCGVRACCARMVFVTVCDGDTLDLECVAGSIVLLAANYGRVFALCPSENTNCRAISNVMSAVEPLCNSQSSCSVLVNSDTIGVDPCNDSSISKYLSVTYYCGIIKISLQVIYVLFVY